MSGVLPNVNMQEGNVVLVFLKDMLNMKTLVKACYAGIFRDSSGLKNMPTLDFSTHSFDLYLVNLHLVH